MNSNNPSPKKIIILGDIYVGKTSIIYKRIKNTFDKDYKNTIGVEFQSIEEKIDDKIIQIHLWDVAGQERFNSISSLYYRDIMGAIIVCDVTKSSTIKSISKWKNEIDKHNDKVVPIIMLCNKIDLITDRKKDINGEDFDKICVENNINTWFYTSAVTGENITKSIQHLLKLILPKKIELDGDKNYIKLKPREEEDIDNGCSC